MTFCSHFYPARACTAGYVIGVGMCIYIAICDRLYEKGALRDCAKIKYQNYPPLTIYAQYQR